jgi:hypothetical protein
MHSAYSVRSRLVGFFLCAGELGSELPRDFAINGLTILYGLARGVIATATGWIDRSFLIPTVYFSRLLAPVEDPPQLTTRAENDESSSATRA